MKDGSEPRKRSIATGISVSDTQATIYDAGRRYRTEWERRSACLRALVADAAQRGDAMLILEQDDTLIAADRKLLYRAARDERCPDLRYEHRMAAAEQLLAQPHAIAWCWAKGGDWRRRIEPVVTHVREVSPSRNKREARAPRSSGRVSGSLSAATATDRLKCRAPEAAASPHRGAGIEENPAFGVVVHPPLGKQLIAIGEWLFGYNSFGWRFASAIAGTLCILLIIRIARRLTGSTLLGGIAGILLICDGVSHVNARTVLLDVFTEVFVLGAFACLLADRDQVRRRLTDAVHGLVGLSGADSLNGLKLGARWWRFAAGFLLGCATGVKWSGVYYIGFFGVLSVVWDYLARREAGVRRPLLGTVRRDLLPSLWSYVVIGIGTYIATWWAWFRSESAWPRHVLIGPTEATWKGDSGVPSGGIWHKLANLWDNAFWQWTWRMLDFHSTLLSPGSPGADDPNPANRHPWESKPWTWPMGTRPVLYYAPPDKPATGCGDRVQNCVQRIFLIGTPMLWWISLFVAGWALWRAIGRLDWRYAAVLVGYSAGYLPWFANLDRQMYFFYATPIAPFLVLGIVLILGDVLGSRRSAWKGACYRSASFRCTSGWWWPTSSGCGPSSTAIRLRPSTCRWRPGCRHGDNPEGVEQRFRCSRLVCTIVGLDVAVDGHGGDAAGLGDLGMVNWRALWASPQTVKACAMRSSHAEGSQKEVRSGVS